MITLYNVCAVPWGVFSTVGGVQYRGGYHEYRGGDILSSVGVFSMICGGIWGDILNGTEHPHGTDHPPLPPTVLHTHYTG